MQIQFIDCIYLSWYLNVIIRNNYLKIIYLSNYVANYLVFSPIKLVIINSLFDGLINTNLQKIVNYVSNPNVILILH